MEAYKREFIQFLEGAGVLKFGDFTAKSGRKIPYFVNAGMIKTGAQIVSAFTYVQARKMPAGIYCKKHNNRRKGSYMPM